MIKIENVVSLSGPQWEAVIRGTRNPMNSWKLSDSKPCEVISEITEKNHKYRCAGCKNEFVSSDCVVIGPKDHKLMMNLRNAGSDHRKYMRMIEVWCDITAPLYW